MVIICILILLLILYLLLNKKIKEGLSSVKGVGVNFLKKELNNQMDMIDKKLSVYKYADEKKIPNTKKTIENLYKNERKINDDDLKSLNTEIYNDQNNTPGSDNKFTFFSINDPYKTFVGINLSESEENRTCTSFTGSAGNLIDYNDENLNELKSEIKKNT